MGVERGVKFVPSESHSLLERARALQMQQQKKIEAGTIKYTRDIQNSALRSCHF